MRKCLSCARYGQGRRCGRCGGSLMAETRESRLHPSLLMPGFGWRRITAGAVRLEGARIA